MPKIVDNEQGVIVVNPNRGNSNGVDNPYTYPLTEDLCIAVNLYVQIPPKTGFAEGVVYELEWNAGNGGSTVSLFKGRSFGPNDSYLTDYYTDINFDSSSKGESVEGLGIQSIDITYNADYIPQVSIKFVDVRGSSVFASANRSHENGNNDESMEGEFFRAFFTMPYPKFVLKVKGYYGRTASFLLSCVECNHTFDSATGNFIIDASFIGYTFAFFADIPFNILKCISLCEYANCNMLYGGSDFHFKEPEDSKQIPTFKDFISSLKTLSTSIEETKIEENSSSEQYRKCQDKDTNLNQLNEDGSGLMKSCYTFIKDSNGDFENVKTVEDNGVINKIFFKIKGENIDKAKQTEILTKIGAQVQTSLKSVGDRIKQFGYENSIPYPTSRETGEIKTIKVSYVIGSKNEYVIDSSSFFKAIKKMMQSNAHEGNIAYHNASSELNQTAYTIMGFSPYIENVMRMIFANLQLFMHAMCTCVNNVSNRKLSDLDGIGDDKELSEAMSPDDLVGAFPSVYDKTGDMPKECWIGDIVKMKDGTDIEEVKFVKAIFHALKEEYKTEQAAAGDEASINFPHDVWYPLFIYDDPFTNYSDNGAFNPYKVISQNKSQNGDVVEEVFALIGLRIFKHMFFNESELEVKKLNDIIIEYEAKNIISGIKDSPTLLDIIQSNPEKVFNSMVKKNIFGKQKTYGVSSVFYNIKDKSDYYMIPFFNVESSKYHIETDKNYDEYPRIIYDGKRPPLGLRIIDNKDIVDGYIKYVQEELQGVENKDIIGCEIVEHKNYDELNSPISFFLKSSIYNLNKDFQKDKNIDIQKRLRIKALHFLAWCCNVGEYNDLTWDSLEAFPSDHVLKPGTTHVMSLAHALYWGGAMWSSRHREEIKDYLPVPFYDFKDCGIDNTLVKYFMDWTSMEKMNGVYGDWVRLCNSSEIAYKDSRGIHPLDEQFWSSFFGGLSDDITQFNEAIDKWQSKNGGKTIVLSNGQVYTSTYKDINMELLGNNKVELQDNTLSEQILRNIFDRSVIVVAGDVSARYTSVYEGQTTSGSTYMSTGGVKGSYPEGRRIASKENFYSKLKDISSQSFYDKYAKRLCKKIDKLRKQSTEQSISPSSSNGGQSDNDVSDKDIYLSIYKCLQNINQKWAPRVEDKYNLSNFYEKSFSYRDKLFNDIGRKFMLNADKLLGLFVNNRSGGVSEVDFGIGYGYSLMEVLNNIFSYHNMLLVPTPNNIDWLKNDKDKDKDVGQSLVDVFTPFQFKDISGDSVPQFIGIYVGMPSTSLNNRVGNGTMSFHKDDGLYLWGSKKTNVSRNEGNTLPCFLISFSDQNNSMFKSISVGTKQNAITEQSLAAMYNLFEDSGKMTAKGQDLYSIYSQNSYQATVEMMGDANIQPLMYFQLNNANIFDGCYMIFKMEHHINENNDMTTRFTGMRMSNVYTPLVEDCVFVNSILGENVFAGSSGEGVSNDGSGGYLSENISNISSSENNSFIGIAKKMLKIFTIEDLVDSNTARQKKIDNTPKTEEIRKNLYALIVNILDPLCLAYQKKFAINSGYRCPELNKEVKGSSNSQHMLGQAADITGGSVSENKKLFNLVKQLNLPFDQMIWEENGRWIHISYGPRNRRDARPKNI